MTEHEKGPIERIRSLSDEELLAELAESQAAIAEAGPRMWISAAVSPDGNEFGSIAVMAVSREEAVEKAREALKDAGGKYVRCQRYAANLVANLDRMRVIESGVLIDWGPCEEKK